MNPRKSEIINVQTSEEDSSTSISDTPPLKLLKGDFLSSSLLAPWVETKLLTKEAASQIKRGTLEFHMRAEIVAYCIQNLSNDKSRYSNELSNFHQVLSDQKSTFSKYCQLLQAFVIKPINDEITRLEREEKLGTENESKLAKSRIKIFIDARSELIDLISNESFKFFVTPTHRTTKQDLENFQSTLHTNICGKIRKLSQSEEIDKSRNETKMFFKRVLRSLLSFGGFAFISKHYRSWVFDTRSREVVTNMEINLDNTKQKLKIK